MNEAYNRIDDMIKQFNNKEESNKIIINITKLICFILDNNSDIMKENE